MKVNSIYIFLLAGSCALVYMSKKYISSATEHFGVAENQTREINLDYPVEIKKVAVRVSQNVAKGDLLLQVYRTDLPLKLNAIHYQIKELVSREELALEKLKGEQAQVEARKKLVKTNFIEKVKLLEVEANVQNQLMQSIESFDAKNVENELLKQKVTSLQNQYKEELSVIEAEQRKIQKEQDRISAPLEAEVNKLRYEEAVLKKQEEAQYIYAPQSGIINELIIQDGQKVDAYKVLMKIYDTRPNIVTTYLTEGNVEDIKTNTEFDIVSIHDPNYSIKGRVIGLSTRITLIPERLRKVPEMKMWGREVQLQINSENKFLQGEKVKVILQ